MTRQWINSRFDFDECDRFMRFILPRRHSLELLRQLADKPEELAPVLRAIITRAMPDLDGLSLMAMEWSMDTVSFEAAVFHPSLPPMAPGSIIKREYLEPDDENGSWRSRDPLL